MAFQLRGVCAAPPETPVRSAIAPKALPRRALRRRAVDAGPTHPIRHQGYASQTKAEFQQVKDELWAVQREAAAAPSEEGFAIAIRNAMPLGFVRSSLFGVRERRGHSDADLRPHVLASDETLGVSIGYSGPRLNQQHARLWQALIRLASLAPQPVERIFTTAPEILRMLGVADTGTTTKEWLMEKLTELGRAQVTMKTRRTRYFGALVTEMRYDLPTQRLVLGFNPRVAALFADEYVECNLARKSSYGRNQLAMWLHDFLSSQHNSPDRQVPFSVSRIQQLCGSNVKPKEFRRQLRIAAHLLATRGSAPLLLRWAIDAHDVFSYEKVVTKVTLLPAGAQARMHGEARKEAAAQSARSRRAGLVL